MLANGIGNNSGNPLMPPQYIHNLKADLKEQSDSAPDPVTEDDLLAVPLYFGSLLASELNVLLDVIQVLIEGQTPFDFLQTLIAKSVMEFHYWIHPEDRTRPVVGIGYSGGFAPLIEALGDMQVPVAGLIGLGAATYQIKDTTQALSQIIDFMKALALDQVRAYLIGIDFGASTIDDIISKIGSGLWDSAAKLFIDQVNALGQLDKVPAIFPDLVGSQTKYVLNVIGSEDLLFNLGAAGWRSSLGGVEVINVKIVGASHYDYMRRSGNDSVSCTSKGTVEMILSCIRNVMVADFVTDLILAAKSRESVEGFLAQFTEPENGVYVIDF